MAKKQREQNYFFKKAYPIPLYGGYFIVIFSNQSDKISRAVNCNEYALDELYAYTFTNFYYQGKEAYSVVFNFWNPHGKITMGTIIHEVTHAGNRLLKAREIIPDWDNDESEAYLKAWMGDCVYSFMKKCGIG